jgi:NTE family protein
MRGLRSSRWFSVSALAIVFVFFLSACGTLETRRSGRTAGTTSSGQAPASGSTVVVPVPTPAPVPMPPVPAPQAPPSFLNKELPKVGVILGPGGMKAYAHIGVLRELARARIPVHAIVGMEWGGVMAGIYSLQGQVNEVEWKAFKLREADMPGTGFLSSRIQPQAVTGLNEFFETAFGSSTIERAKVEFACPAYWSRQEKFGHMAKGPYKDAMRVCLPYPPLYSSHGGVWASPMSVEEGAAWLRSRGANLIVVVNVLAQGEIFPARLAGEHAVEQLLWSEVRREMQKAKSVANHVIQVNTTGHPITDFAGRRALMEAGSKSASDVVNKLVDQYGF